MKPAAAGSCLLPKQRERGHSWPRDGSRPQGRQERAFSAGGRECPRSPSLAAHRAEPCLCNERKPSPAPLSHPMGRELLEPVLRRAPLNQRRTSTDSNRSGILLSPSLNAFNLWAGSWRGKTSSIGTRIVSMNPDWNAAFRLQRPGNRAILQPEGCVPGWRFMGSLLDFGTTH